MLMKQVNKENKVKELFVLGLDIKNYIIQQKHKYLKNFLISTSFFINNK